MAEIIEEIKGKDGRRVLKVSRENFLELMEELKKQGFNHLSLITGVDWKDRIELVYHLHNVDTDNILVIKSETTDNTFPSVTHLWKSADWDERETWDLMGVWFQGHENLKRLFLPESWIGHPLRKNYDLSKVQYINMDDEGEDYATYDPGDGW